MKRFLFFLMAITFAITGFSQTALNEGFEGAVFPPEGWTKATTQGNESWSRHTSNNPIGTSCASVDKQIEGHVNYLITPKLSITEELNTIRFWCKFSEQLIGTELYVLISTTDNQLSSFDEGYRIAYSGYGSTQWTQKEVALSEYLGENIYVAFKVVDQNGARVFLDDFTGPNLYSSLLYPTPTLLQVSNPTSTGIDLGWNDPTGFAWNIQYMLASETDWEYAERVFTTTNPYTLNLNNSSIYKARVKQNGHVGYSDWSYPITFRTACDAITMLPWYEDFDYPWDDVYVEPGNKTAPYCWFNIDSVNTAYYWQSSDSPKNGNSAICMHGYDGESSSTDEAHKNNDWLISPIISFTGAEQLTFWAKKSSDLYNPDLLIYAMDVSQGDLNATASNANFILVGSADTLLTTNYEKLKFDLSCLVGNHRLAFVRKKTASGSVFVDEVLVNAICQKITGLNATSIVSYELYIGWDDHSAPMYELEFIDESETDWTYSYTWSSYNNPAQIIDLPFDACSVHKVRARAVCDFGDWSDPSDWNDHSDWTDPLLFTVGGYPISYLPYEENFDWWNTGDSIIPDCWVRTTNQENYPFIDTGGYFNNCLTFYAESPGTYNIIAMETIDEYIPITSIKANFYYKNFSLTDKLIVGVMTDPRDASTFVPVQTIQSSTINTWAEYEVVFSTYIGLGRHIAFKNEYTTGAAYGFIDELVLENNTICEPPTDLIVSDITSTTANISFTPADSGDTEWKISYRKVGSSAWNEVIISSIPYQITGLDLLREYNSYEVYVQTICSDGTYSNVSSSEYFNTICQTISEIPYTENFDSYGYNGPSSYVPCWTRNLSNYTDHANVYPHINAPSYSGTGALYFCAYWENKRAVAVLNQIDPIIPINTLTLSFKMYSLRIDTGIVVGIMTDPNDFSTFVPVGARNNSDLEVWQDIEISLNNYSGIGTYIALVAEGKVGRYAMLLIDDLVIDYSNNICSPPLSLSTQGSLTTMDITVTPGNTTDAEWYIYYKSETATSWDSVYTTYTTTTISGLSLQTNYQIFAKTLCPDGSLSNESQTITYTTPAIIPPTLVTSQATSITQTTATLNGTITIRTEAIIEQGFEWRLTNTTQWTTITSLLAGNTITHNLTGLMPNTDYEYRAYATTASGTSYGLTQTFTTLAIVPPTVVTSSATSISQTLATLNGTITIGTQAIIEQGFEWRLTNTTQWTTITSLLAGNTITHNLTGLMPNTDYEYRAYANTASGTTYGLTQTFTTLAIVPPTVVTSLATSISQTVATLNGTITAGTETIIEQGFEWRLTNTTQWTTITSLLAGNTITHNLTGLMPNTDYEYRAYATTASGTTYGIIQDFTTLAIVPPTVVTSSATSISQTLATLNGTITIGTEAIIEQGFEWRLTNTTQWTTITSLLAGNAITHNLIGLMPNTDYEYRAYATTATGTSYGLTQTFTTLAIVLPIVETNVATSITEYAATLNGTITIGNEVIIAQGFAWKTISSSTPTIITETLVGNTITHTLTGLTPNTQYEYVAYATTATGLVYGQAEYFTTLSITPPTVITNAIMPTSGRIATLSGTITAGSEAISSQGFEWKEEGESDWTIITVPLTGSSIQYMLIDLSPSTAYNFRAYAITSDTTYGITQSFVTLGLNNASEKNISIMMYPNPATSQTNLVVSGINGETKIVLSDVQGRILNTINAKPVSGTIEQTIDLNNLAKGVYYIRIQNSDINRTQKLIVK